MEKVKLFCFPYAGGSSMIFNPWKRGVAEEIEVIPVELAGRGKRSFEPFYGSFVEAVEDLYQQILPQIGTGTYAFFGHSMGSWLAYEIAHQLKANHDPEPTLLVLSGRFPPHLSQEGQPTFSSLSDADFREEIYKLGGMPEELYNNQELFNFFSPILRSDLKILEEYQYRPRDQKLSSELILLSGAEDQRTLPDEMPEWKGHTSGNCHFYEFSGGHFFINQHEGAILKLIDEALVGTKAI